MNSFVKNPGGLWTGDGIAGTMFNPALANIGSNNTVFYKTHSVPTESLCPDIKEVKITVNQLPTPNLAAIKTEGCSPFEVVVNLTNSNTGSGVWNFGDGSPLQQGLNTSHVYSQAGTYTVSFNYSDDIGCNTQTVLAKHIKVYELPKADFSAPMEVLISNPDVQFINLSTVLANNKYTWDFGSFGVSSEVNPGKKFDKLGRYPVTLQAITVNGCKDEVTRTIEVKNDFNVYIPSSFTPNYDGINDVFLPVFSPYGLDTKSYEMEIFDRWGHPLFYSKDPAKGWDGSVNNKQNQELKEEVYVFKLRYKDLDGNLYNKMGHITLLK
jgi:gliding motility-associated-like protein